MGEVVNLRSWLHDKTGAHEAIMNALERPFPTPRTVKDMAETASWLLEALWLEGYKVVPIDPGGGGNEAA